MRQEFEVLSRLYNLTKYPEGKQTKSRKFHALLGLRESKGMFLVTCLRKKKKMCWYVPFSSPVIMTRMHEEHIQGNASVPPHFLKTYIEWVGVEGVARWRST